MRKYFDLVLNNQGQPIAGALVTVRLAGTLTSATLYEDEGITPKANPVTTDSGGLYWFYVDNGLYDLVIQALNFATITLTNVLIEDAATSTDLSNSTDVTKGDALVSGKRTDIGAVAFTLHEYNENRPINVLTDFIPSSLHAGIKDGTNSTDLSPYIRAAFNAAKAKTYPALYFPAGVYLDSGSTTSYDFVSNFEMFGDGMNASIIRWNNGAGAPYQLFGRPALSARTSNISIHDIAIRGNHDSNYVTSQNFPILFYNVDGLRISRVKVSYSRIMGIVTRGCFNLAIEECLVQYCARDGINTTDCNYVRVADNTIEFVDDDAIACSTGSNNVLDKGYSITGNVIRFSQGIKCLGAKSTVISGNTIEYCMGQGISVLTQNTATAGNEGVNAASGVIISNNVIKNCIDRAIVDALNTTAPYIIIGGDAAQAGSLAAIPGENDTATGDIVDLYPYFENSQDSDETQPIPGNYNIIVSGNTLVRDTNPSGLLSALGYGSFYTRTGPIDPTLTTGGLVEEAIVFQNGIIKNALVSNNVIMGLVSGFAFYPTTRAKNVTISNNIVFDCSSGLTVSPANTYHQNCRIHNNIFDLDPLHTNANRGLNGTFLADGGPTALLFNSAPGWVVTNNTFKNCGRISDVIFHTAAEVIGAKIFVKNNIQECNPTVEGYNAANVGIGHVIRGSDSIVTRIVDGDPASATYGNVLNNCPTESGAMPTSGKYVRSHFVKNNQITKANGLFGWSRVTTGSGHTLNSDWVEIRSAASFVSADKGNADATLTVGSSEQTNRWETPLTADRAVTLSTSGATNGYKFRIVRTASATGAFNLNVGTGPLKALGIGQWCDVEYNSSAWMLTAFGSL